MWFNLAHVCRNWRAVMFASASRLDLGIAVGPEKPGHIKTILSSPLPIYIDYQCECREMTDSALWRMRVVLQHHHDRVRRISLAGSTAWYDKFVNATNYPFPVLESLDLRVRDGEVELPDTFLRGPDLSDLHLRGLELAGVSLASISRFLLSATALTDLSLAVDYGFSPSAATSLFTCLQGMPFLRRLCLYIARSPLDSQVQRLSTPKHIVPLSKLTHFYYRGHVFFLDALMTGILAPSLRDVSIYVGVWSPIVHLPHFINGIEEHYHAVHVDFQSVFRLSLMTQATQSSYMSHHPPCFTLSTIFSQVSIDRSVEPEWTLLLSDALSARFVTAEELHLAFDQIRIAADIWLDDTLWLKFLRQFPSVKALQIDGGYGYTYCIAPVLLRGHKESDDDLTFLPALEEIELHQGIGPELPEGLEAFQPFISARQKAGRPVKVLYIPYPY